MIRELIARLERRLLLRSLGMDPAEADKPAPEVEPVRDQWIEVGTTRG